MRKTIVFLCLIIPTCFSAMKKATQPEKLQSLYKMPRSGEVIDFGNCQLYRDKQDWIKYMEALRLKELLQLKNQLQADSMHNYSMLRPPTKSCLNPCDHCSATGTH